MLTGSNKDTITTPSHRYGVSIVNFEHISHLALVFLLLTFNRWLSAGHSVCTEHSRVRTQLLAVNYFCKKLYLRCLTGFSVRLQCFRVSVQSSSYFNEVFLVNLASFCKLLQKNQFAVSFAAFLTHLVPLVFFLTPWKHLKGDTRNQWHEIGQLLFFSLVLSFIINNKVSFLLKIPQKLSSKCIAFNICQSKQLSNFNIDQNS